MALEPLSVAPIGQVMREACGALRAIAQKNPAGLLRGLNNLTVESFGPLGCSRSKSYTGEAKKCEEHFANFLRLIEKGCHDKHSQHLLLIL